MKNDFINKVLIACIGNIFIGAGIGFLNVSLMGVDCYSAFVLALGKKMGMTFAGMLFACNVVCFILEFIWGRKYIGAGTFINLICVGNIATVTGNLISRVVAVDEAMVTMIIAMVVGVLALSFGISLYQQTDMGVAPYDSLSLILEEKFSISYFWCRIITDALCAVGAFLLGGLLGVGTLVCAFGLGPIIQFFDNTVSKKLFKVQS